VAQLRTSLLKILRAPGARQTLTLYPLETYAEDVIEGILVCETSQRAYPVIDGVPVMLDSAFPDEFLNRHAEKIAQDENLRALDLRPGDTFQWSFSSEWKEHFDSQIDVTWGWTVDERKRQFLLEVQIDPQWCDGKWILDAGCGNGQLSEALTELGATVVGFDYSSSVLTAEKRRKSTSVHFVRGDLQSPPFEIGSFDLIISNGVLHHTPSTYRSFVEVCKLVKPGGRFYLWLYRKSERFLRRYLFCSAFELVRSVVSRLPQSLQGLVVKAYAYALLVLHKVLGKYKDLSWPERVVGAYDSLTPRWRHYHTPLEVSCWFSLNGFSSPTITHWDNPYGFGMVAVKIPQTSTPGVNFGKSEIIKRYWN
jgi:2-polyprenyl-3-methyl-5-hydroxy-6-metoxy-1,4-benzoquinol methylase